MNKSVNRPIECNGSRSINTPSWVCPCTFFLYSENRYGSRDTAKRGYFNRVDMGIYSKLHDKTYQELTKNFPQFTIRENIHPDWLISSKLTKLELDIFIEEIKTAIEIQGSQHYKFTPIFHKTYFDFEEQQRRDREKSDLCQGNGIRLVEIASDFDLMTFIDELKEITENHKPIKRHERIFWRDTAQLYKCYLTGEIPDRMTIGKWLTTFIEGVTPGLQIEEEFWDFLFATFPKHPNRISKAKAIVLMPCRSDKA